MSNRRPSNTGSSVPEPYDIAEDGEEQRPGGQGGHVGRLDHRVRLLRRYLGRHLRHPVHAGHHADGAAGASSVTGVRPHFRRIPPAHSEGFTNELFTKQAFV
ncbi:hypothetical protein MRX96_013419 [Rhipicephalus microplus]